MRVMLGLANLRFSGFAAQGGPIARRGQEGQNRIALGVALHDLRVFIVFGTPTLDHGSISDCTMPPTHRSP
jgi:hypothetical protein